MLFQTPGFATVEDIANRALQHCGGNRIASITESSKNAREVLACYTKLRQAELRRANWVFAIKRNTLYPINNDSMAWTPPAWAIGTTYAVGQVVSYDDGFGSRLWSSNSPANIGNAPGYGSAVWDDYFGPLVVQPWSSSTAYYAGDLVYERQTNGTFKVFRSLLSGNSDDPATTDTWDATVTYDKGAIVTLSATNYVSIVDSNFNNQPPNATYWSVTASTGSYQWVLVGTALVALQILYPISAGPSQQRTTKNCYPLPYGYLSKLNQDPKAGSHSFFGAPTTRFYDDWLLEGSYIVTQEVNPIVLRYRADVTKIAAMNPMFCEGLGARIALEVAEIITQSTEKLRTISTEYQKFMTEARIVDAIENEAEEASQDDYLVCRY